MKLFIFNKIRKKFALKKQTGSPRDACSLNELMVESMRLQTHISSEQGKNT